MKTFKDFLVEADVKMDDIVGQNFSKVEVWSSLIFRVFLPKQQYKLSEEDGVYSFDSQSKELLIFSDTDIKSIKKGNNYIIILKNGIKIIFK